MSKHWASPGYRMGGIIGPGWRRLRRSSQLTPWKKGWALTRPAPPLILPRRLERSIVQNDLIMSLASSEMCGSWGKTTGFSTILAVVLATGWRRNETRRKRYLQISLGSFCPHESNDIMKSSNLLLVNLNRILVPERRVARHKFVYQDAQRPPVHCRRMALIMNDLWRKIFGRPT